MRLTDCVLFAAAAALAIGSAYGSASAASTVVTWADFVDSLPRPGVPRTVPLGGGTTVDVTVTTGGTQGLYAFSYDTLGAVETGLPYDTLVALRIFNGGGHTTVHTSVGFSNFHVGLKHVRGLVMVGRVSGLSSPITLTCSTPGAIQSWATVGSTFVMSAGDDYPIAWNPGSGTFSINYSYGHDSRGIVVDVGSLSQYATIGMDLNQNLDDGIDVSLGEEVNPVLDVPRLPPEGSSRLTISPNPSLGRVRISLNELGAGKGGVWVFSLDGRSVRTVFTGTLPQGGSSFEWDGRDDRGAVTPNGVYFVAARFSSGLSVARFVVMR